MDIILDKYFNKTSLFVSNEASSDTVSIAALILTPDIFDILRGALTDGGGEVVLSDAINIQTRVAIKAWHQIRPHHALNTTPRVPETLLEKIKTSDTEKWGQTLLILNSQNIPN